MISLPDSTMYKDILMFNLVKKSKKPRELVTMLALFIGQGISYHELATELSIDKHTVKKIDLLEKSFVIFRLYACSNNQANEINKR